jgi:hypothetical protein
MKIVGPGSDTDQKPDKKERMSMAFGDEETEKE